MFRRILFNWWYYRSPPWDTGISPPELIEFLEQHPAGRALDLGCGSGTNAITMARYGWQITAVDFAWRAIHLARRKAREARVEVDFRLGDVTRLKGIEPGFDLILDIGCFHGLSAVGKKRYITNLERWLAPQGTYLLYGWFKLPHEDGPGLVEGDVQALSALLELEKRQNGHDRGNRQAAWFTFRRKSG